MTETAPRKKAKGDTFMRAYLMRSNWWTRSLAAESSTAMGSKARSLGWRSTWDWRGTVARRPLPSAMRWLAVGTGAGTKSL